MLTMAWAARTGQEARLDLAFPYAVIKLFALEWLVTMQRALPVNTATAALRSVDAKLAVWATVIPETPPSRRTLPDVPPDGDMR